MAILLPQRPFGDPLRASCQDRDWPIELEHLVEQLMTSSPPKSFSLKLALPVLTLALLYAPVFLFLIGRWWGGDDYSHGFLVPVIFSYLIWQKREQLAQLPVAPSLSLGLPTMILAGLMLTFGKLGSILVLEEISLLIMIVGLILSVLGTSYIKALAFPVSYLIFMLPIFDDVIDQIHWPFQLLAAGIGSWLLQGIGIPVFRQAQYLQLPRITLEVAEVCSGVRYLISVLAIGIPLAYLTQHTFLRRGILVGFAVSVALLANGLRVALIGVWVHYSGHYVLHGPFHVFQGLFVGWIGFAAIFAGMWLMGIQRDCRELLGIPSLRTHARNIKTLPQESGQSL